MLEQLARLIGPLFMMAKIILMLNLKNIALQMLVKLNFIRKEK